MLRPTQTWSLTPPSGLTPESVIHVVVSPDYNSRNRASSIEGGEQSPNNNESERPPRHLGSLMSSITVLRVRRTLSVTAASAPAFNILVATCVLGFWTLKITIPEIFDSFSTWSLYSFTIIWIVVVAGKHF